jgi:hypothetical protein
MTLEISEQESRTIPPGNKISEIFDEMEHALLILGAPGSGKTVTLLELARDLIARAEQDHTHPIPVVFNLSSWAERKPPLAEWLADEMSVKYQIPRKIGRKWLADNDILALLDGLDEVQVESRTACAEAINAYYGEHGLAGIAVCSRVEEYGLLKAKLKLASAILIQALTDDQIADYVASFGAKLAGLYKALRLDVALKELAHSPLMLGVMSLAYADVSYEDVLRGELDSMEARRKRLFDTYVERMFKRKGADRRYSREQTIKWLSWLARGMEAHKQSVFLIEGLQPSWVSSPLWRWQYVLISRLIATFIIGLFYAYTGLLISVIGSGLVRSFGPELGLFYSPIVVPMFQFISIWLIGGLSIGIIDAIRFEIDHSHNPFSMPANPVINMIIFGVIVGSGVGLITGAIDSLIEGPARGTVSALGTGLVVGAMCALIFGLRSYKQSVLV